MSITLAKGQQLSLAKNAGLSRVSMGLGWDAAKPKSGGFFGKVFGGGAVEDIDLDASVIVFDAGKQVLDTVWFRQLTGMGGAIRHSGDNRTGDGDGDDETISIDLSALPASAMHMVFTVNSFLGQTFDKVENAVCRLVDARGNTELCRFNLAEKGAHTGAIMAVLSRASGAWEMTAIGRPTNGRTVKDLAADAVRVI
ncbi:TerD family protein [Defluviimonas salinarum]|uniref:TerD family protein n=1 Tax=Defluviimonas salinarum TaxID=2992147 RepID=A0ABT3J4E2_9RHOB|nr:TerD family protein [Defluviimonas salinarum]MCW3782531.1 TerD family protein [Defluviimonas salinarum]